MSIHFSLHELVQLVLILLSKIKSTRTEVVDGSNESLEHADEDLDTLLRKYSPLQKIFKKSSVCTLRWYEMHRIQAGSFQVPPGNANSYKNGLGTRKNPKSLNQSLHGLILWYLGYQVVWDLL